MQHRKFYLIYISKDNHKNNITCYKLIEKEHFILLKNQTLCHNNFFFDYIQYSHYALNFKCKLTVSSFFTKLTLLYLILSFKFTHTIPVFLSAIESQCIHINLVTHLLPSSVHKCFTNSVGCLKGDSSIQITCILGQRGRI